MKRLAILAACTIGVLGCRGDRVSAVDDDGGTDGTDGPSTSNPGTDTNDTDSTEPTDETGDPDDPPPTMKVSARNHLIWKRYRAFAADLSTALALETPDLCAELDQFECVGLNQVALGGHDAVGRSMYTSVDQTMVITPIAVDRIVLSGCSNRVDLDREAEEPEVFRAIDLGASSIDLEDASVAETVQTDVTWLYRRFHQRNPTAEELEILEELTLDDDGKEVSAADFAKLACFTIGSTTEFIFY